MTNYVMVPVPEQHVPEVMQRVLRLLQLDSMQEWDQPGVEQLWAASDEITRSLLSYVARSVLMGKPITDVMAAEAIEISLREAATVMRDANEVSREMNRPSILLLRGTQETLPNGRTVDMRYFVMTEDTAKHIRNVERAQHESNPHPLLGDEQ